ncbi:XrtA/PEP-CTERM system histidine kinase PrsK [Rhodoferax sp.]|uniref:XrtA/PEP-CTERM system histidine kinase PrsK n=1 Tax=Rhodoferax sp. TaxID=50421 RepID=UPI0025EE0036|nr:XrtA/PEP-CTERM system histidine kinase PrsK [Rhodoferax sp.]
MDKETFTLTAVGYALVALVYGGFALRLMAMGVARAPRNPSALYLLFAVIFSALWGGCQLLSVISPWWVLLGNLADILRYGCWFGFMLLLCRSGRDGRLPSGMAWLPLMAAVLVGLGLGTQILAPFGVLVFGDLGEMALMWAMALPVLALVLLEQIYRNVTEDSRWNVKPLSLGLAGLFLFDLYLYSQAVLFKRLDSDALSIRGAVHALMVLLLLLSTTRRHDWISSIRVSQKAAFHSATLLVAGAYLIFISAVGYYVRYFGGEWGRALQVGVVFSALIALMVLALSGSFRAKLRVLVGKHFFRYRYDYREEWLKFTQTLSSNHAPQDTGQQVVRALADMLDSPGGGLWMKSTSESVFRQTAHWNLVATSAKEDAESSFCQFLVRSGWVINLEEYRSFSKRYGDLTLPLWLQDVIQAWLIVPLTAGGELIGFVVLARARTNIDVNWEVNDLLKTAGRQAASYLAQMRATEALLEGRKFDAFNRMSAFVVHDLKNIVTQLSLMLKNAKRLHANPEFQQDMLMTVENSLDRMRQLMLQLREGATPPGTAVGVDLGTIVQRISLVASKRGRHLDVTLVERIVTRGHEERLERIIGHIVQNAFDATDPSGRVWLKLDRFNGQARVEIGDTGHGMSEEFVQERLFKPFQTTKQAGMGIGAYESFQYVQELGGKILVNSALNEGTLVTLLLPLFEVHQDSDLHVLGTS